MTIAMLVEINYAIMLSTGITSNGYNMKFAKCCQNLWSVILRIKEIEMTESGKCKEESEEMQRKGQKRKKG